jgi:hypothetical protein
MLRRTVFLLSSAAVVVALVAPGAATGKSVGGCPDTASGKWELVTVESLGPPPEGATGLQSLDGNGDGMTCIKRMQLPNFGEAIVFRDNTVGP